MYFSFSPLLSKHSNKGHLCLKEASQGHVNSINAEKEQLEARSSNWQIILFFLFVWLGSAAWHDRHPDTYLPPFPCENLRFVQYKGKGPLHSCSISQLAMHSTCARLLILQASKLRNLILTVKTQRSGFKWRFNLVTERVVKEIHTAGVCSACKELNYRRKLCFLMSNSHPTVILVWLWCIRCMWLHLRPHFVFKCWCILFRVFFSRYLLCFTTSARVCHVLIKGTFMMLLLVDVKTIIHLSHF